MRIRYPAVLLLLLLPHCGWASQAVDIIHNNKEVFDVAVGDPSQGFLAQLFGSVGTALHGTSGQLLGQVFHIFNIGVLVLASLFFIFTIITTVVNSAHEGRFMGSRQAKPAFSIMRTVAGFGLLLPLPSGYSLVQVLTMTIVLQGVGFANTAWNAALDYFADGGVVLVPPSTDIAKNINLSGTVLQAQVCMYHQQKVYQDRQEKQGGRYVAGFQPSYTKYSVRFPSVPGNSVKDAGCGEFTWTKTDDNKNRHMESAMQKLVEDTGVAARHIVDPQSHTENFLQTDTEDAVVGGAADWLNFTLPARAKTNDKLTQYLQQARDRGWIFAGTYYYGLTKLQRDLEDDSKYQFKISKPILGINACGSGACDVIDFPDDATLFRKALSPKASQGESPTLEQDYMHAATFISKAHKRAIETDKKSEGGEESSISASMDDSRLASLLKPVYGKINSAQRALRDGDQSSSDPILQLQIAGNSLMSVLTAAWILGSLTIFGISAVASTFSSYNSIGFAIRDMLNFFTPIFMMLCTLLFVQGAVMAIYIPMVPFIIFTFAVMGWFVIVVESMAAAPLVALGLAHHEGHDMWGRSEEAIWLWLNVFLRPVLMIIGLLAAMLLSRIGLKLLNVGYNQIIGEMHGINDGFYLVAELTVYISLAVMVVNVSYGLIHKVPDRVMRWLRAGGDQLGDIVNQATKGAQDMTSQVGQSRGRMGSESLGGGRAAVGGFERKNPYLNPDKSKKRLSASTSSNSNAGGGGGSGSGGNSGPTPGSGGGSSSGSSKKKPINSDES